jgi:hypothetical protein
VSALGVLALVLGILLFIALLFALILIPVSRRARRMEREIGADLGDGVRRKANAQGLGLQSAGRGQVRGNGWLVLTDDELRFKQWIPAREDRIPRAAITEVSTPRVWLGKTVGRKLLCVRWRTPDGGEDAMAWEVRDVESWLSALQ